MGMRFILLSFVDVFTPWRSPNRENAIDIPAEGLAMLRYFPLEAWVAGDAYAYLESPVDRAMKE